MKKSFAAIFVAIFAFALLLSACASDAETATYTWTAQNAEFQYPVNFNVISAGDTILFVTQSESGVPMPGQGGFELMISYNDQAAETTLTGLSGYDNYSQEELTIGSHDTYQAQYTVAITGDTVYTIYVIENEGTSFSFVPSPGYEDLAQDTIKSLILL